MYRIKNTSSPQQVNHDKSVTLEPSRHKAKPSPVAKQVHAMRVRVSTPS